jgi:cytochrome b
MLWRTPSPDGIAAAPAAAAFDAGQGGPMAEAYGWLPPAARAVMKDIRAEAPVRPEMIWNLLIRLSGIALFVLLVVAYSTGEEFPHTHVMIGYAIAALVAAGIFWAIVTPHEARFPPTVYSPRGIKTLLRNADRISRTLVSVFSILVALPLCALMLMLLTHTLWGTTWIDEMHEVVAYFAVGLVAFYVVMVAVASSGHLEDRLRKLLGGGKDRY